MEEMSFEEAFEIVETAALLDGTDDIRDRAGYNAFARALGVENTDKN